MRMKRSSVVHLNCSVARSLEVLGEWWSLLIIRTAFFGIRRFDDFVDELKISRGILTERLATLVEHQVLEKLKYQTQPDRFEYRLTKRGLELFPVVMTLMQWGDKWLSTPAVGGAPVEVLHQSCGQPVTGPFLCSACLKPVNAREVSLKRGPGSAKTSRMPRHKNPD